MEDMLKLIVDMDEKARELKSKAEQEKLTSEQDIQQARQKLYEDYLQRARARAKLNTEVEKNKAEVRWEESKATYKKALDNLNAKYKENADKYVAQIVDNVLKD